MKRFIWILLLLPAVASGQKMDSALRMSAMVGVGWTHYYNSLVVGHEGLKNNFLGSSLRIMWEPEHRLAV
ncbi:MAG TPA: hypothetical protein VG737_12095, partial [Cyclobacteriaceae bacterium]|nr:hypothetical protein [Cyclobacteriaceae bacterium]